jgi:uncharacterized protein YecE (DUF72 family)
LARAKPIIRIGTSGYQYAHWRGCFYPEQMAQKDWFQFYTTQFDTVEINNTFYHLPLAKTFAAWSRAAPANFCYAVKLNRYITHIKRLKAPAHSLRKFTRRAEKLEQHLGPILVQLPPHWDVNQRRLETFLKDASPACRWCVEFRDPRWLIEPVYKLLKRHNVALCLHDMIEDHPKVITTSWTYLRFHGYKYSGSYSAQFLKATAERICDYVADGLDVYVYFNNDAQGYAPKNALELKRYVGIA